MPLSFHSGTDIITYRFNTCGFSGQYGPTLDDCSRHYERTGSPTAGVLHYPEPSSSRLRGIQYFKVPATDWYTVTASGGRGGLGVCTRWPGVSIIVQIEHVFLQEGTVLEVSVGHQGTDACSNNPQSVSLCQLNITTIAEAVSCSSQWRNISNSEVHDGGGGGGGGSLIRYLKNDTVILLVGGAGGESAQYDNIDRQLKNAREGFTNRFSGSRPNSAGMLFVLWMLRNLIVFNNTCTYILVVFNVIYWSIYYACELHLILAATGKPAHCKNTGGNIPLLLVNLIIVLSLAQILSWLLLV